jgi:hypothetical protein
MDSKEKEQMKNRLGFLILAGVFILATTSVVSAQTGPFPKPVPTIQPEKSTLSANSGWIGKDLVNAPLTEGCTRKQVQGVDSRNPTAKVYAAFIICESMSKLQTFIDSAPQTALPPSTFNVQPTIYHGKGHSGVARPLFAPNLVAYAPGPSYKCGIGRGIGASFQMGSGGTWSFYSSYQVGTDNTFGTISYPPYYSIDPVIYAAVQQAYSN